MYTRANFRQARLILMLLSVLIITLGAYASYIQHDGANTPQVPTESEIYLLSTRQTPQASSCEEPPQGEFAPLELRSDTRTPPCITMRRDQRIQLLNTTNADLLVWFGEHKELDLVVPAQGEFTFFHQADIHLSDGVHTLHGEDGDMGEVWVISGTI